MRRRTPTSKDCGFGAGRNRVMGAHNTRITEGYVGVGVGVTSDKNRLADAYLVLRVSGAERYQAWLGEQLAGGERFPVSGREQRRGLGLKVYAETPFAVIGMRVMTWMDRM